MILPRSVEFLLITADNTQKDPIFSSHAVDPLPRRVPPLDRETAVRIEEVQ